MIGKDPPGCAAPYPDVPNVDLDPRKRVIHCWWLVWRGEHSVGDMDYMQPTTNAHISTKSKNIRRAVKEAEAMRLATFDTLTDGKGGKRNFRGVGR